MITHTVFETPCVKSSMRVIANIGLWAFGWKTKGAPPDTDKYVLIAAPHTSNWDLVITLSLAFHYNIKVHWMGKSSLFRFPYGGLMKWLGGIPVDREKSNNLVKSSIRVFEENSDMVLIVPPEGTRGKVRHWKTGFYHIAHGAKVPIALGFVDFKNKTGGFGPALTPTGDIKKDMPLIQKFYQGITGKIPEKFSTEGIALKQPRVL